MNGFMNYAAVVVLAFATARAEDAIKPAAATELFNGKDLGGWVQHLAKTTNVVETWSVKDGLIVCAGKPNGYLRTEKNYTEYRVVVEWRFTKPGNTGVCVHMGEPDKVWPKSIECQGMHNKQGDFWFWGGASVKELPEKKNGVPRTKPDAEKPLGEWNTFEVVCSGDTVAIVVNGTEVNKVTGSNITDGHIGLQSEGAGVEIRKVTLKPL